MEPERKGHRQRARLAEIPAPGSSRILSTPSVGPPPIRLRLTELYQYLGSEVRNKSRVIPAEKSPRAPPFDVAQDMLFQRGVRILRRKIPPLEKESVKKSVHGSRASPRTDDACDNSNT